MQQAWAQLWTASDAQDCLDCREGYRPGRRAWEAVRALSCERHYGREGSLVEADRPGFVDPRAHAWLGDRRRVRLDERAWLQLSRTWLQAGGWERAGQGIHPETGPPQGGPVSLVLAPVSRPDALDLWLDTGVQAHGRGEALWGRYGDDGGGACRDQAEAERCSRVRPQRLKPCPLQVAPETTHGRRLSRLHPRRKRRCTLLGFACCWRPARHGGSRVLRRPARTTLQAACPRRATWSQAHRPLPERAFCQRLKARVRGHDHYDGVRGKARSRPRFCRWALDGPCKGRKRRGGQPSSDTWEQGARGLDRAKRARPRIPAMKRRRVCACQRCFAPRTRVQPRNRRREHGTSGSARGVPGNRHSYRRGFSIAWKDRQWKKLCLIAGRRSEFSNVRRQERFQTKCGQMTGGIFTVRTYDGFAESKDWILRIDKYGYFKCFSYRNRSFIEKV